jgi:hypothetical protein
MIKHTSESFNYEDIKKVNEALKKAIMKKTGKYPNTAQ